MKSIEDTFFEAYKSSGLENHWDRSKIAVLVNQKQYDEYSNFITKGTGLTPTSAPLKYLGFELLIGDTENVKFILLY